MGTTWSYLDLSALGRQEEWEDSPEGWPQTRPISGGSTTTRMDVIAHISGVPAEELVPGPSARCRAPRRARMDNAAPAKATEGAVMQAKTTLRMKRTFEAPA